MSQPNLSTQSLSHNPQYATHHPILQPVFTPPTNYTATSCENIAYINPQPNAQYIGSAFPFPVNGSTTSLSDSFL